MRINFLKIKNFRNLENVEVKPGKLLNLFIGGNAQGKTSLLEGIYFSNNLKSFRTNELKELIQFEKKEVIIQSNITHKKSEDDLSINLGEQGTSVKLNNKKIIKSSFIGKHGTIIFSPDSLTSIKQGPEKRRDLIDAASALIYKEAIHSQKDYQRAIKQKNVILKSIKEGKTTTQKARGLLESINEIIIPISADILFLRLKLIDVLVPRIEEIISRISGKDITIKIENYSKQKRWIEREYQEIKERISKEIKDESSRVIEETLGVSFQGPHRHDIRFLFDEKDARSFCSQGQQRALILAFKMAQIVYHGEALKSFPILLLDDVLSEFDEKKQKHLLDFLQKNEAQTFLTATEAKNELRDAAIFSLNCGRLEVRG